MSDIRIGIVGCGAVTSRSHLPAFQGLEGGRVTALADPQVERARELAARFSVPRVAADYCEILHDVDAVILALPHNLHASIGTKVLRAGKHVLMEKPLANTVEECDALIAAAESSGKVLAVGQVRRYMSAYKAVRQWLDAGLLGELTGFEAEEGGVYNWPVASDFFFRPEMSGGGVLMDTGAHVLDVLLWWLGDLQVTGYEDDSAGGIDADCTLRLRTPDGLQGTLILSRVRGLTNRCILHGTRGTLEVGLLANQATLTPRSAEFGLYGSFTTGDAVVAQSVTDLFREQVAAWIKAMRGESAEIATAVEAREVVRVIRGAYAQRVRGVASWERPVLGVSRA